MHIDADRLVEELNVYMTRNGMTQTDLANKLDVSIEALRAMLYAKLPSKWSTREKALILILGGMQND